MLTCYVLATNHGCIFTEWRADWMVDGVVVSHYLNNYLLSWFSVNYYIPGIYTYIYISYIYFGDDIHAKYVDWPLCAINENIFIIGHRYASLFYCRKHIDVLPWFSHVGNAYEWSTLKVMLHIVGWQAQQQQYEYYKARSKNSTRNPNIHTWPRYVRASPVRRSDFL